MKKLYLLLIPCLFVQPAIAQNNYDYQWITGYGEYDTTYFGGTQIDFSSFKPEFTHFPLPYHFGFDMPCSIADENGQLQFYSNGCSIYNADHELVENGADLAPGYFQSIECDEFPYGYDSYQDMLILPRPGYKGQYVYFHHTQEQDIVSGKILFTLVDMNANNQKGRVIWKNQLLRGPVKAEGSIGAVKHGNGRDWWVIIPQENVNLYNIYLLDPDTIRSPFPQNWEDSTAALYGKTGWNVCASPDGTKFARVTLTWLPTGEKFNRIFLYDFDRCSGMLSNPKVIRVDDPGAYASWVAFSPNSRYLYFQIAQRKLFQFDIEAPDIDASGQLIGEYDGFKTPKGFSCAFHAMAMGPDNKLYMCCTSGTYYYHTIHSPDKPGQACDFRQHDLRLTTVNGHQMPNYPNYRLGPMDGSLCDSLGIDNRPVARFRWARADSIQPKRIEFTDLSYFEPATWSWDFGDGAFSQDTNPVHIFPAPGVYTVSLTVCNVLSCDTWLDEVTIGTSVVLNPEVEENPIRISPNPAADRLFISSEKPVESAVVTDATGKEVLRTVCSGTQNWLDIDMLPQGVYFLVLHSGGKIWAGKFMKG